MRSSSGQGENGVIARAATTARSVTWAERERIAKQNRALLDQELREKRVTFASRPYEAHVQFSNFCNMSCIMCWDGENPPVRKMAPELLEKVATQIAPSLSVITPHSASEPLVVSWDETLRLVRDYSVQLALTTNTQFLDETKLDELKEHAEMVVMSIDSHIPEVFEKIRPGGKSGRVFENLPRAAHYCEEHGIECMVQVVFMTENAAAMPETVAYMADAGAQTVNVIQMIDTNGRSGHLDALLHFSHEYLEELRQRCVAVARDRRIRLGWDLDGPTWVDFREPHRKVRPRRSKASNDKFDTRMHRRHPGFCKYSYDRLQIELSGDVEPCGLATEGELILGNLAEQDFDEIWNGPSARDLRRGHYTWDYPSLCKSCRYVDLEPPAPVLAFVTDLLGDRGQSPDDVEPALVVEAPAHMTRQIEPPVIRFRWPDREISEYMLALAPGGEVDGMRTICFEPVDDGEGMLEFPLPAGLWEELDTNIGWWWAVLATSADEHALDVRSSEVRCVVRHEDMPRIEGSSLRYPDQGHLAPTYLGGEREIGFNERGRLPTRPPLREKGEFVRTRHVETKTEAPSREREHYQALLPEIRAAVAEVLPPGSTVLVVSRGDEEFTALEGQTVWHFPADDEGRWIGYHPPDSGWAIEHLEALRMRGAQFLVLPAPAFWWLEHYRGFADHLDRHYAVIAEHQRKHIVYDLREPVVPVTLNASRNGTVPVTPESSPAPRRRRSLITEADDVLGYGGQHRTALRPFYRDADDVFPSFAVRAEGCELTDSAGRTFVDWVGGGGPVLLGYRHPAVEEAVREQLEAGPTLTLMHPVEVEVAQMLQEMIPCAEQVTFGKNGSDVLAGAIRVARAATGREIILQHGVHGFHEWFTCMHPGVLGIPKMLRALVQPFPYNDLDALAALFERYPGEVAAIVMEPMTFELPEPGYLERVRDLAHQHGALLVFDEMVTGFRLANGGAQELFGVTPDLACFGKGLANGMPLSALVGAREHMQLLQRVAYGMTFRGETLSLAAARATLEVLRDQPVTEHIARTGAALRAEFERACAANGVRARLLGHESRMTFAFHDDAGIEAEQAQAIFLSECAAHGVLTNGNLMPSQAHDDEAVQRTAEVFGIALERVGELMEASREEIGGAVHGGFRDQPAGGLPAGFIDAVRHEEHGLFLCGWMLYEDGPPDAIEAVSATGTTVTAVGERRPDLPDSHPDVPGAETGGFNISLPAGEFSEQGDYEFTLRALKDGREVFALHAVRLASEHESPTHRPWRPPDGVLHL
jgi:glutamate-1-semialdehyde 2,1-aminomutase